MTTTAVTATRPQSVPFTGAEYLESLRDGREVWIYGERVPDITTHPAFRNSARSVARLYDALHDPQHRSVLTTETDTGNGGFTHRFYRAPRSQEDLLASRDAIAAWQRLCFGFLGRSPDTRRPSSLPWAPMLSSTHRTKRTPGAGTGNHKSGCCT